MIGIKTRLLILNRNFLKKRFGFWSGQTYKLHLSAITHENVKEDAKISPEERMRMKQKRKEARRLEYLENQKQNQLKKKVEKSLSEGAAEGSFPETYHPSFVESKWYNYWMEKGIFNADSSCYQNPSKKSNGRFAMCLPPPNVTGNLHLGHALGCSVQDAVCRWHRMNGGRVTWVPGCDHAGIATQVVVEKKLMKDRGLSRHDIGREKFLEEVWKWKEQYGGEILEQMKRLGCSLDWSRMTFTLDSNMSRAVREAFIRLFEDGLIQRSTKLVNWSCALKSTISDIEVDTLELSGPKKIKVPGYDREVQFGVMHTFAYPMSDSDEKLMVSTTRLETMLGDVGVAVHPDDARYSKLIGKFVIHPFTNKPLPIVPDNAVSPDFGTGVVKLTPGHDPIDLDIASRHKLDLVNILDESGRLINVPEEFENVPRFKARHMVQQKLDSLGLMVGVANHPMNLPICSRTGDVVEYIVRDQWFVDCQQMASSAREAVESGRLEFVPGHYVKHWNDWLTNPKDWCISRQLWWGHRIPAYKVSTLDNESAEERWVAAHDEQEAKLKASKLLGRPLSVVKVTQDEDVLDTWFSSALIPFSVFGWPDKTTDLERFYPTDLLDTASDIMFFWVARMVMMGEKLTGQLPFKKVHFHSIVQDAKGRKMSKSLGNVVDPMHVVRGISLEDLQTNLALSNLSAEEIKKAKPILSREFPFGIPECGADALRFALCSYSYHNHFVNVDVSYMKFCTTFCNKIWQSFKFVASKTKPEEGRFVPLDLGQALHSLTPVDRWILSRLSGTVTATNKAFDSLKLFEATKSLQNFWWSEFCNVYMECIKPSLSETAPSEELSAARKSILIFCFQNFLKLLHPFMPFLSEHLFQEFLNFATIGEDLGSVCTISLATYPLPEEFHQFSDNKIEEEMKRVLDISLKINSMKNLLKIDKYAKIPVILTPVNINATSISTHLEALATLTRSNDISLLDSSDYAPVGCMSLGEVEGCVVHIRLKDVVDVNEQLGGLSNAKSKHEKELRSLESHPALSDIQHDHHLVIKEKLTGVKTMLDRINNTIKSLEQI